MNKALRQKAESRGRMAEWLAALYLRCKGYRILSQHERANVGEIDIIAQRGNIVAFIEVKARDGLSAGLDAISNQQQQRIIRAASSYISNNPALTRCDMRFDAIVISPLKLPTHITDAWRP